MRIDPDGNDDFMIFRPLHSSTSSEWSQIQAIAGNHGHTVTIYNQGGDNPATKANYHKATGTKGANVFFVGHVPEYEGERLGVLLTDGGVGNPLATTKGQRYDEVGNVSAASVSNLGCESNEIKGQYSDTKYTGTDVSTDVNAQDAGAAAMVKSLVSNDKITDASFNKAVQAGQDAMQVKTKEVNKNNYIHNLKERFKEPMLCTTENGKTTCHR